MRKILLFIFLTFNSSIYSQTAGSIAFIGFNADGGDDLSFVVLEDLPNPTTIFFTDNEPTSSGGLTSGEGVVELSLNAIIPAGTVIVLTDVSSSTGLSSSIGTLSDGSGAFNLSSGGDAVFAFLGTDETTPTTFLAGMQNESGNQGDLAGAGLVEDLTFNTINPTSNPDGLEYNGNKSNEIAFSDYLPLIANIASWDDETSNGENILPLSMEPFTIQTAPVKLTVFIAEVKGDENHLSWITESEINNDFFQIERSKNGKNFEDLEKIAGFGNTLNTRNYKFIDVNPYNGSNYYRLKQVDFDGKFEYSKIVRTDNTNSKIRIYPTSTSNFVTIDMNEEQVASVTILNTVGQVVKNMTITEMKTTIDISNIPSGIYYVAVDAQSGKEIKKVIKQ